MKVFIKRNRLYSDNEHMKMSKLKMFVIISIIVLLLIVAGALTAISVASYKPTVAFYNVSEKVQETLLKEIQDMPVGKKNKKLKYNVLVLDSTIPLSSQKQIKKAELLFATMDMDVQDFAKTKKVVPLDKKLLEGMPSATRATALMNKDKLLAVPLLYDMYEIDVNRPAFNDSKVKRISIWNDLVSFLKETKKNDFQPMVLAGGNPDEALNFVGSMVEAVSGKDALVSAEEKIYAAFKTGNKNQVIDVIEKLSKEGEVFYDAIKVIQEIYKDKCLNQSTFSFQTQDSLFYIENELCNTVFLKLSDHRKIDFSVINYYTSIYVPGTSASNDRGFLAPTICGLALKSKNEVTSTLNLLSSSRQSTLSLKTGLAPVQANCSTPDTQADDVRFWLAASTGPIMPLSGALPSEDMKKAAAEWFATQIRFGL